MDAGSLFESFSPWTPYWPRLGLGAPERAATVLSEM